VLLINIIDGTFPPVLFNVLLRDCIFNHIYRFMYFGEVNVCRTDLEAFLIQATFLKVWGLMECENSGEQKSVCPPAKKVVCETVTSQTSNSSGDAAKNEEQQRAIATGARPRQSKNQTIKVNELIVDNYISRLRKLMHFLAWLFPFILVSFLCRPQGKSTKTLCA